MFAHVWALVFKNETKLLLPVPVPCGEGAAARPRSRLATLPGSTEAADGGRPARMPGERSRLATALRLLLRRWQSIRSFPIFCLGCWPYNLLRLDWTSAGSCQVAQSDWVLLPLQRKVPKMKSMSHVHPTSGWRWPL